MRTRFLADQHGGVAPVFALALVPMIGLAGAAIDYSRANAARTAMQAQLDSAALMVAKDAQTIQSTQASSIATNYFNASFNRPEVQSLQVTASSGIGSSTGITATNGIRTHISPVVDPYVDVPAPTYSGCNAHNYTAKNTETINPGVYS